MLASGFHVSSTTVLRKLLEAGRKEKGPTRKQYLNLNLIKKRFTWAKQYKSEPNNMSQSIQMGQSWANHGPNNTNLLPTGKGDFQ